MRVIRAVLALRHARPALMAARYEPLVVTGPHAERLVAFRRVAADGDEMVVVIGRCLRAVGEPPIGATWGDTAIPVSDGGWNCVLHGRQVVAKEGRLLVAEAFSALRGGSGASLAEV